MRDSLTPDCCRPPGTQAWRCELGKGNRHRVKHFNKAISHSVSAKTSPGLQQVTSCSWRRASIERPAQWWRYDTEIKAKVPHGGFSISKADWLKLFWCSLWKFTDSFTITCLWFLVKPLRKRQLDLCRERKREGDSGTIHWKQCSPSSKIASCTRPLRPHDRKDFFFASE